MGIFYSELCTRLILMSSSIWWDDYAIFRLVGILGEQPPLKIWLDTGTNEPGWELARFLRDCLIDKGWRPDVDLKYLEVRCDCLSTGGKVSPLTGISIKPGS